MPRLPQIISTQRPVSRTGVPRLPLRTFTATEQAVEVAGHQFLAVAEERLERQTEFRDLMETTRLTTEASLEVDAFIRTQEEDPDFESHPQRVQAGLNKILQRKRQDASNQRVKVALQGRFNSLFLTKVVQARRFGFVREVQEGQAELFRSVKVFKNKASESSGQELDANVTQITGTIAGAVRSGLITALQGEKLRAQTLKEVDEAHVLREGQLDPLGTAQRLTSGKEFEHLDPVRRQNLQIFFLNLFESRQRQQRANEAAARADLEREQELMGSALEARIFAGEDLGGELQRQRTEIGPKQFSRLMKLNLSIGKARVRGEDILSDPETVQDFERRLLDVGDPLVADDVIEAMDDGRLAHARGIRFLQDVKTKGERDAALRPEQRTARTRAEGIIKRGLQVRTPGVERVTGEQLLLQNQAINLSIIELHRRLDADATLDALALAEEIVAKKLPLVERPSRVVEEGLLGRKELTTYEAARDHILDAVARGDMTKADGRFMMRFAEKLPRTPKPPPPPRPLLFEEALPPGEIGP